MFLKKKAHNLFAKSVKLALKNVRGSVTSVNPDKNNAHIVAEETSKPKKVNKPKKKC